MAGVVGMVREIGRFRRWAGVGRKGIPEGVKLEWKKSV